MTPGNDTGDGGAADAVDRPERVDRRTAMKAALAGVAAAAVWSAPRIEGLSVAPDVAQAASCVNPSADTTNHAATTSLTLVEQCWVLNAGAISCSDFTVTRNAGRFNIGVRIGGDDGGELFEGGGFVKVTVNGIDPPFQRCTVNVQANCFIGFLGGLTASGSPVNFVINNNGTFPLATANQFSCNVVGWLPERTIVNVACVCL